MPRTTIAAQALTNPNPTALTALTFTAADVANMNQTPWTGTEVILAWNKHATSPFTVTLTSATDPYGRTGNIAAESVAAGVIKGVAPLSAEGWRQTDGMIYFQASDANIFFAVLKVKP